MSEIPEIIWWLIGLLLFAVLLSVGFNTTLGDFLKTKLAQTILCVVVALVGTAMFVIFLIEYGILGYGYDGDAKYIAAAGAILGGLLAIASVGYWFAKVRYIKTKKH